MKNNIRKALSNSGENYLEAVLMIQEKKGVAYSVDLAHKLGVSKPSVSVAVHALENEGYLIIGDDKALRLTDASIPLRCALSPLMRWRPRAMARIKRSLNSKGGLQDGNQGG